MGFYDRKRRNRRRGGPYTPSFPHSRYNQTYYLEVWSKNPKQLGQKEDEAGVALAESPDKSLISQA